MATDELQNLEDNIQRLKQQLAGIRDAWTGARPEDKVLLQQRINDKRIEIKELEREKWDLIASDSQEASFPDAEVMVAEIITEVTAITTEPPPELASAQILESLNQILAKLNQPERSAAAKLKAAISTIPPFVSLTYEAELDTESTFKRYFPTFNRVIAGVKNRLKK
jgi:septal ring factor EnvC (AmiA/AmiB activator)